MLCPLDVMAGSNGPKQKNLNFFFHENFYGIHTFYKPGAYDEHMK